jgi:hypothetical protein
LPELGGARSSSSIPCPRLSRLLLAACHGSSDDDHRRNSNAGEARTSLASRSALRTPPDGPRFLTVGVKGDDFQLVLWPGTPGAGRAGDGTPPSVDHDRDRQLPKDGRGAAVARGRVRLGRARVPWGYVAEFYDPDDNRLQIREGR